MNFKIDRHNTKLFPVNMHEILDDEYQTIKEYVELIRQNPSKINLGGIFREFSRAVSKGVFLERKKEYIFQFLYYANQISKIHFKSVINDGNEIEIEIGSKTLRTVGKFKRDFIGVDVLAEAFYVAFILRDIKAITLYISVPFTITEKSITSYDEFSETYIAFLKSLFDPNTFFLDELDRAIHDASDERYISIFRKPFVTNLYLPTLLVYQAILTENQELFDLRLAEALKLHRNFYEGNEELESDASGLISFRLIAACVIAHDNGLKINVDSDYLPMWMIERDYRNVPLIAN